MEQVIINGHKMYKVLAKYPCIDCDLKILDEGCLPSICENNKYILTYDNIQQGDSKEDN